MRHYLTKEECHERYDALRALQEADPSHDLRLTFIRDDHGWYADVPTHTRSENAMVAGADKLLDIMSGNGRKLSVSFRFVKDPARKPVAILRRFTHGYGLGASYLVSGVSALPFPIWLCDVTHDVVGDHPKRMFVYSIEKEDTREKSEDVC